MGKSVREGTSRVKKTIGKEKSKQDKDRRTEEKPPKKSEGKVEKAKVEAKKAAHKKEQEKSKKKSPPQPNPEPRKEKKHGKKDDKKRCKVDEKKGKDKTKTKKQKVKESEKSKAKEKTGEKVEKKKDKTKEAKKKTKDSSKGKDAQKILALQDVKSSSPEESKEEQTQKRQPALRQEVNQEAPKRRVSFKGAPATIDYKVSEEPSALLADSFRTPSPKRPTSPSLAGSEISLDNLQAWKSEASKRGLSLEAYMEEISREQLDKTVEDHMKNLIKETEEEEKMSETKELELEDIPKLSSSSSEDPSDSSSDSNQSDETLTQTQNQSEEDGENEPQLSDDNEGEEEEEEDAEEEEEEEDSEFERKVEEQLDLVMKEPVGKTKEAEKEEPVVEEGLPEVVAKQAAIQNDKYGEFSDANSTNSKAAWDKFSRQCMDRKKFPVALAGAYVRDKLDLFRCWLNSSQDWSKVSMEFERRAETKNTSTRKRAGTKARDIMKQYPKEKAEALIKKLKDKGMYYYDPDFENDPEEIFYYTNCGNEITNQQITSEQMSIKVREDNNQELAEALTAEGGPLQHGLLPEGEAANEAGKKALAESIANAAVAAAAKPKPSKAEKTEKAEPKTLLELAADRMEQCLSKGASARKFAISLANLEYSGDLADKMMQFSSKMEKLYQHLQDLVSRKVQDKASYTKYFAILDDKTQWYEKAEAAAKGLQTGLKPKKAKSKAKPKGKASEADQAS